MISYHIASRWQISSPAPDHQTQSRFGMSDCTFCRGSAQNQSAASPCRANSSPVRRYGFQQHVPKNVPSFPKKTKMSLVFVENIKKQKGPLGSQGFQLQAGPTLGTGFRAGCCPWAWACHGRGTKGPKHSRPRQSHLVDAREGVHHGS